MGPQAFWALLWGDAGQWREVRVDGTTCWIPCERPRPLIRLLAGASSAQVGPVSRSAQDTYALAPSWVLWARLERPGCADLLGRLPVGPTLVVREGRSSRRTALWALSRPLCGPWITRANERLAHACQGRRGTADASALIGSPFTGSAYIEYESDQISTARQIVGRLKDAPATDGWKKDRDDWRQAA
jgi:hypothetical protein